MYPIEDELEPSWDPLADSENASASENPQANETRKQRRSGGGVLSRCMMYLEGRPLLTKSLAAAIIGAIGGAIGTYDKNRKIPTTGKELASPWALKSPPGVAIDWLEVLSFALYGLVVGGPLEHWWEEWMKEKGPESKSISMLFDQLVVQPPRLLLMFMCLDISRAVIREVPSALNRSLSAIPTAVVHSWRVWPVAVYIMLSVLKKRRHYTVGMNICTAYWISYLARRRVASRRSTEK